MIRTIVIPDNQIISLQVPKNFIGKKIEVIAFAIDEALQAPAKKDSTLTHLASQSALTKDWNKSEEDTAWQTL